jgi:SAM-dependent methyltransferase
VSELSRHQAHWEALGTIDPLYAILSAEEAKHGGWDEVAFFAAGEEDVRRLMETCDRIGLPRKRATAFELGCGVGRLTRALSSRFAHCTGVDISAAMIAQARRRNADRTNCEWFVNTAPDLRAFADGAFDLVLSHLVLQHLPTRAAIAGYLAEMARILAPGGLLVAQVPASMPLRQRLQPRRRVYGALRRVRIPDRLLYERLGLNPIRMNWIPRRDAERALVAAGARVVDIELGWLGDRTTSGQEVNLTYLATRDAG